MDARNKIMQAAELLFADNGFEGTSTRALAQEAGVNLAMISYYFGSKEELYKTLIAERTAPFRHTLETIAQADSASWQKMVLIIENYVDRLFENSKLHQIMYRELGVSNSPVQPQIREHIAQNMQNVNYILQKGIENGEFKPDIDIQLVMPTLTGTIVQVIKSPTLSMLIMGLDPEKNTIFDEKYKNRLKNYLENLLKAYILI